MQIDYQCYIVEAAFRVYECICNYIVFLWNTLLKKKALQRGITMQYKRKGRNWKVFVFSAAFIINQDNSELVKHYQENNQVWEIKKKKKTYVKSHWQRNTKFCHSRIFISMLKNGKSEFGFLFMIFLSHAEHTTIVVTYISLLIHFSNSVFCPYLSLKDHSFC